MTSQTLRKQQQVFAFSFNNRHTFDEFVSGSNVDELRILRHCLHDLVEFGNQQIFLAGDKGSGTSHLLKASCAYLNQKGLFTAYLPLAEGFYQLNSISESIDHLDFIAIDDVTAITGNKAAEKMLFDIYNQATDRNCALMFAAKQTPKKMNLLLPDLQTRLSSCLLLHIKPLLGDNLHAFVRGLLSKKGMQVDSYIIDYILTHYSRSCHYLQQAINLLEQESLRLHKPITKAFIRACLDSADKPSPPMP